MKPLKPEIGNRPVPGVGLKLIGLCIAVYLVMRFFNLFACRVLESLVTTSTNSSDFKFCCHFPHMVWDVELDTSDWDHLRTNWSNNTNFQYAHKNAAIDTLDSLSVCILFVWFLILVSLFGAEGFLLLSIFIPVDILIANSDVIFLVVFIKPLTLYYAPMTQMGMA